MAILTFFIPLLILDTKPVLFLFLTVMLNYNIGMHECSTTGIMKILD